MVTPEGQGRMLLRPGVFAGRNKPGEEKWIRQERKGTKEDEIVEWHH